MSRFSGAVIIAAILLIAAPARIFSDELAGDDASYVAHAFTIAFDGDLDYSNESFDWVVDGPNGPRPAHPIGPGLAAAPFVTVFALLDRLEGHPVVEDRNAYAGSRAILGFFVASAAALGGGALALISAIRFAGAGVQTLRPVVVAVMGSGVPFYALNRSTMSHSFEFLFLSLMILAAVRLTRTDGRTGTAWLLLSASTAMTVLIRPANIIFLLLPAWALLLVRITTGTTAERVRRRDVLPFLGATFVFWTPALWVQTHLYGSPLVLRYRLIQGPRWSGPDGLGETLLAAFERLDAGRFFLLLFGAEFGIAWSSPIVLIGAGAGAGLAICAERTRRTTRLAFLTTTGLLFLVPVMSVFGAGQLGIDYGNRFLMSLVPPAAFALGLFLHSTEEPRRARIAAGVVALSCVGVLSAAFYQSAGTTDRLLTHSLQENIFEEPVSSSRFYGRELASEVLRPQGWIRMLAVRVPGFLVVSGAPDATVIRLGTRLGIPDARLEDGLRWSRRSDWFDTTVISATLAGLIILLLRSTDTRRPEVRYPPTKELP